MNPGWLIALAHPNRTGPARAIVPVRDLRHGVEIQAIAAVDQD